MTSCLTWVRSPLCSDRKDLEFEELPSREQIKCAKIWVEQYWKHLIAEYFKKCKSCMPSHINASQADSKQDSRVSNQEPSLWRIHLWPALTRLPTPLNPVPQSNFPNGSLCVHRKQVIPTTANWSFSTSLCTKRTNTELDDYEEAGLKILYGTKSMLRVCN
jgi:hypothetical protein